MARTHEYNEENARASLMATFLEKGYADTSLSDLEANSGLNRRQIYNDFGDKRMVFLQSVRDFMILAGEQFLGPLERAEEGIGSIEATLFGMIDLANTKQGRLGCLVCNTARETIAEDPEVGALIDKFFRRIERGYRSAIKRGMRSGEISSKENARALSRFFLGVHVSLCVMSRAGESVPVLNDIAGQAMKRLN